MIKLKLLLFLLFSLNSIYGQYNCELEINSGKLNPNSIENLFSFSSSEFENIAMKFREKINVDCFQVLYYRNTGKESLSYLYLDKDSLYISNNSGFKMESISQNNYKIKINKELNELFSKEIVLLTQSCPQNYGPIGNQIIEFIFIKQNNFLFLVYYGDNDSVHGMKQNSTSLKLKKLIDEIYFKWIEF